MSYIHGGQLVGRVLKAYGVDVVFTLCGGHVMHIYEGCIEQGIKVIDVRHEQATTHCADGWARLTGKPGVAIVTAGPGVTDAITGVVNAQQAESPILLIGGQAPMFQRQRGSLQEINHCELLREATKWSITCFESNRIPEYLHKAFRIMTGNVPGPVFMEMPVDTLLNNVEENEVPIIPPSRYEYWGAEEPRLIEDAARVIASAKKPMIMAGASVYYQKAWPELAEYASKARIPVFLNSMGRGCLPKEHPYNFGQARKHCFKESDCIIVIGSPIDFRLGYGKTWNPKAKVIQIERDAEMIGGNNRKADLELVGNVKAILQQLVAATSAPDKDTADAWYTEVRKVEDKLCAAQAAEGLTSGQSPVHPLRFAQEVANFCDDETIIIGDGGNIVAHTSKVVPVNRPGHWMDPGKFGCLGVGVPFAISARLAFPQKKIVLVMGDGSFGFNGMEYDTAVRFNLPFVGIVGNDAAWAQIRGLQKQLMPNTDVATKLSYTRYDKVVEGLGGHGEYVERPEDMAGALQRAFDSGKPSLVNVKIDAEWNSANFSYSAMGM